MERKSGKEVADLIVDRVLDGLCPICGEIPKGDGSFAWKLVTDSNLFLRGDQIKVCTSHIVDDNMSICGIRRF